MTGEFNKLDTLGLSFRHKYCLSLGVYLGAAIIRNTYNIIDKFKQLK